MTDPAPKITPIKDDQKRRYIARVKDTGEKPRHGGEWFRVKTHSSPEGEFGTRAWAQDALERALEGDSDLVGHVDDIVITQEPTLETIKISDWLEGNVVAITDVPEHHRAQYEDTLRRGALAAYRFGHKIHVNSSFRQRAEQEALYDKYLHGGALAAVPGTSPHERGIALDIPNARTTPKLIRRLRELQLIDDVPSEIWHVKNHHRV